MRRELTARLVVIAAVLLVSADLQAGMEFILRRGDKDVSGGEVCFYKPGAQFGQSPAELFFGSNDVRWLSGADAAPLPGRGAFSFSPAIRTGSRVRIAGSSASRRRRRPTASRA